MRKSISFCSSSGNILSEIVLLFRLTAVSVSRDVIMTSSDNKLFNLLCCVHNLYEKNNYTVHDAIATVIDSFVSALPSPPLPPPYFASLPLPLHTFHLPATLPSQMITQPQLVSHLCIHSSFIHSL